jgi:hypothetical protein
MSTPQTVPSSVEVLDRFLAFHAIDGALHRRPADVLAVFLHGMNAAELFAVGTYQLFGINSGISSGYLTPNQQNTTDG